MADETPEKPDDKISREAKEVAEARERGIKDAAEAKERAIQFRERREAERQKEARDERTTADMLALARSESAKRGLAALAAEAREAIKLNPLGTESGLDAIAAFRLAEAGKKTGIQEPPPVSSGFARFYHGGNEYNHGGRDVTPSYQYAAGYATHDGRSMAFVHYIDIPENDPHLNKTFDDTGSSVKSPFMSFTAPPEMAKRLKPYWTQSPSLVAKAVMHGNVDMPPKPEIVPPEDDSHVKFRAHLNSLPHDDYEKYIQTKEYAEGIRKEHAALGEPEPLEFDSTQSRSIAASAQSAVPTKSTPAPPITQPAQAASDPPQQPPRKPPRFKTAEEPEPEDDGKPIFSKEGRWIGGPMPDGYDEQTGTPIRSAAKAPKELRPKATAPAATSPIESFFTSLAGMFGGGKKPPSPPKAPPGSTPPPSDDDNDPLTKSINAALEARGHVPMGEEDPTDIGGKKPGKKPKPKPSVYKAAIDAFLNGGVAGEAGVIVYAALNLADSVMTNNPVSKAVNAVLPNNAQGNAVREIGGMYKETIMETAKYGVSGLANELASLPKKFHDLGESVVEANRGLAQYSGQMSLAYMQLDAERIGRDITLSNRTAASAAGLAGTHSALEQSLADPKAALNNVVNRLIQGFELVVIGGLEAFKTAFPLSAALMKYLAGKDDPKAKQLPIQLLDLLAKGEKVNGGRNFKPIDPKGGK